MQKSTVSTNISQQNLNTYSSSLKDENLHLILIHDYEGDLEQWCHNFASLNELPEWRIWGLDLLEMRNSSRLQFHICQSDYKVKIIETEDWFIDSLEKWREQNNLKKIAVVAHSFEAYVFWYIC